MKERKSKYFLLALFSIAIIIFVIYLFPGYYYFGKYCNKSDGTSSVYYCNKGA